MNETSSYEPERELPLLAAIGGFFRWLEELLAILSGPLLTAGLLIALIDLLTDGALLASQPELLYGWAIAMGTGLDAQLIGASVKLGRAARAGRVLHAVLYAVLVVALAYVAFVAAQVFATQQADGITTAAALARLGMDSTTWLIQRSALSVALVVLSGLLRYTPPARRATNATAEVAEIAAKQQVGIARIQQWRAFGDALRGRSATMQPEPPTDGGTPAAGRESGNDPADDSPDEFQPTGTESASSGASIRLVAPPRNRTRRPTGKRPTQAQLRAMAFGLLDSGTVTSQAALRDALGIRQERANSLYHAWRLEHGQQATPVARAKRAR